MPPDAVNPQAVIRAVMAAMAELDIEYIQLMQRMGCKNFTMYRF